MNKRIILIAIVIVGALIGLSVILNRASYHTVTFTVTQPDITGLSVEDSKTNKAAGQLTGNGTLSLAKGNYTVTPAGPTVDTTPIPFTVASSAITVQISPGYSSSYLSQLLSAQTSSIAAALTAAYPIVTTGFKVNPGQLYLDGTWYATTLVQNPPHPKENGDVYRTVLHQTGGAWKVVAKPAIVLSAKDYPTIPVKVLRDINAQSGY